MSKGSSVNINLHWCWHLKIHTVRFLFCDFHFCFMHRENRNAVDLSAEKVWKQIHATSECAYVHMRMTCTQKQTHVCNEKTETRDALQLLVPSDEAELRSDRFHLPFLNLNLPEYGMSNSLGTNGIRQPTSNVFLFCCNKGAQMCIHPSSKICSPP